MNKPHSKKLSIPCFWELPSTTEKSRIQKKLPNKYRSGRSSPQQSMLQKFTIPSKCITRQNSPKESRRNSPIHIDLKPKVPSHIVKRKKIF